MHFCTQPGQRLLVNAETGPKVPKMLTSLLLFFRCLTRAFKGLTELLLSWYECLCWQ
jgi:hypothetical protein